MNYKYGVAIVLYNPTKKQISNIMNYRNSFDKVFIFDNSEPNFEKHYCFDDNFIYLTENENKGLPYAFNKVIENSYCKELDFLCTLDQDSLFEIEDIKCIINKIEIMNMENIGIIAPYIDYGSNHIEHKNEIQYKNWVITSGSFINLEKIYNCNLRYDENYFIDKCEIDLCKQFTSKGYKIVMFFNSFLYQQLGEKGRFKHYPNHSALRHYYLFRNRLYFNNKWYRGIKKNLLNILQTIKHISLIILFENDKIEKIKQLKIAIKDYKNNKYGKRIIFRK